MNRFAPLCFAGVCLFALAACGGKHGTTGAATPQGGPVRTVPALFSPAPAVPGLAGQLPAVPKDQTYNPVRMTAGAQATQLGSGLETGKATVTPGVNSIQLSSSTNHLTWAEYLFAGAPGETITACSYTLSALNSGGAVYCAISNYSTNRWDFLPLQPGNTVQFTLPDAGSGGYQSALGNTWLLVGTYGGDSATLDSVGLTYSARFTVSGHVMDKTGAPIPGVTIASTYAALRTVTDANGDYSLGGLPGGTWAVLATKDGWAFYSQPSFVTVAGGDATAPDLIGDPHGSRSLVKDIDPGNDNPATAPFYDFTQGPLHETLSGDDDIEDDFRFTVTTPGQYILQFHNPQRDIMSPFFALHDAQNTVTYGSESIFLGNAQVAFTVETAPRTYIVQLFTLAGGGAYDLQLIPSPAATLTAAMYNSPADHVGGGLFDVTRDDTGETTSYFGNGTIPSSGAQAMYDPALVPAHYTVAARLPGYTFTNPTIAVDLTAQPLGIASFSYTAPLAADSFEPNNSAATAHDVGALPYDSTGTPLQVTADPAGDNNDYYKFTPPAGVAVSVVIASESIRGNQAPLTASVLDSTQATMSLMAVIPTGVVLIPTKLTDGNAMYLRISANGSSKQVVSYSMQVGTAPGYKLQLGARLAGTTLLDGVRFVLYDGTFSSRLIMGSSTTDHLTPAFYVPEGTTIRADCYRYGTPFERMTQALTMPAADTVLYFDAPDLGQDALEPNNTNTDTLVEQALPAHIDATLSVDSDGIDYYQLAPGDGKPFKVTLTAPAGMLFGVTAYDHTGAAVGTQTLKGPQATAYFRNDGAAGQKIAVSLGTTTNTAYSLDITTGDAYKIGGLVQNTIATGLSGTVVNLTTNDSTASNGLGGGNYAFSHLVPPGDYQLAAYVIGYGPEPNIQTVTITNADALAVNFTNFTTAPTDDYEPNNTAATAYSVLTGFNYTASTDINNSDPDYYSVHLLAGHIYRFTLDLAQTWETANLAVIDPISGRQTAAATNGGTTKILDFPVQSDATYTISVQGIANYRMRVDPMT